MIQYLHGHKVDLFLHSQKSSDWNLKTLQEKKRKYVTPAMIPKCYPWILGPPTFTGFGKELIFHQPHGLRQILGACFFSLVTTYSLMLKKTLMVMWICFKKNAKIYPWKKYGRSYLFVTKTWGPKAYKAAIFNTRAWLREANRNLPVKRKQGVFGPRIFCSL